MSSATWASSAATEMSGSLRISLRPAVVSPIAFSALLYWLHDRTVDRVLVSFFDREWSHEMVRSREEAVRKLMARVDFGQRRARRRFPAAGPAARQRCPQARPLRACSTSGRASGGKYDRERLAPLLERALNGRFVLVEAPPTAPSHTDQGRRQRADQARRVLACALDRHASRTSPTTPTASGSPAPIARCVSNGEPDLERRRCGHQLAAAVAPELPLSAAAGAVQRRGQLNHADGATLVDPGINLRVKAG